MMRHLFATPSNPVRLVKPGDEDAVAPSEGSADPAAGPTTESVQQPTPQSVPEAALDVATVWWVMIPVVLVAFAAVLTFHLRISRIRKLPIEERAFRGLARAAKVPTKYRVLARRLADTDGAPPPVAVLLSDGALALAATRIEAKPGSSTDRVLREYLRARGVPDPRPAKSSRKAGTKTGTKNAGSRINTAA